MTMQSVVIYLSQSHRCVSFSHQYGAVFPLDSVMAARFPDKGVDSKLKW